MVCVDGCMYVHVHRVLNAFPVGMEQYFGNRQTQCGVCCHPGPGWTGKQEQLGNFGADRCDGGE